VKSVMYIHSFSYSFVHFFILFR